MVSTAMACTCLRYLIKKRVAAEAVRIIKSSMSQEYCVTCWERFPPQASPRSAMFSFPRKVLQQQSCLIILIFNSCKWYVLIFHVSISCFFMVLVGWGFFSPPNSHHGITDRSWISAGRSSGPTSCSNNQALSRGCIPESGCLAGGHRRLPTSLQRVSQWRTRFLHPLETTSGWDKVMLMASPTSDAGVWRGGWKRNKAESHSVSSQSSEKEEDSSHMKEQEGAQTPKARMRKEIPAPRIPRHPERKRAST